MARWAWARRIAADEHDFLAAQEVGDLADFGAARFGASEASPRAAVLSVLR